MLHLHTKCHARTKGILRIANAHSDPIPALEASCFVSQFTVGDGLRYDHGGYSECRVRDVKNIEIISVVLKSFEIRRHQTILQE